MQARVHSWWTVYITAPLLLRLYITAGKGFFFSSGRCKTVFHLCDCYSSFITRDFLLRAPFTIALPVKISSWDAQFVSTCLYLFWRRKKKVRQDVLHDLFNAFVFVKISNQRQSDGLIIFFWISLINRRTQHQCRTHSRQDRKTRVILVVRYLTRQIHTLRPTGN